jgi:GDP/UDP-N,N'-diacetylbacillosamine 2-epimerase (hydrolysing)
MKKICVLTGSRAEYGLLKPIMLAIQNHSGLRLSLIVTGMHLSKEHGYTVNEIIKDGFEVAEQVDMGNGGSTGYGMAHSIGIGIQKIAASLKRISPDILLVLGDRIEPLSGVIAAAYMNIPIAHIHGGDTTRGGLDESARHAITKFSHIHFPATKKSAERILKLGEDSWRVHIVGAPSLDNILHQKLLQKNVIEKRLNLDLSKETILLVQHSVTTEPENARFQIIETLEAIRELKYQTVVIYPNSDAGSADIISQIKKYARYPFIKSYKNLPYIEFLSLMKYVSVMVGNSSSGIIESSPFRLPIVNIGIRQEGRERSDNVLDTPHRKDEIIKSIKKALFDMKFKNKVKNSKNPYGDGNTGQRVADILASIPINKSLLQKKIAY